MSIERFGQHYLEDWAIKMMANSLCDELIKFGYIVKKEIPYFKAMFATISRHPDLYRRNAYSADGMRFSQHETDKKGRVKSCVADFASLRIPTDEQIDNFEKREKEKTTKRTT